MANDYDKLFRENIEQLLVPLARRFFGANPERFTELPDDIQTTIERRPDFLKKVVAQSPKDKDFLLHIEVQTQDDHEMIYRMMEYSAILIRKYKIDVRQSVVYIGTGKSKMMSTLQYSGHHFRYRLISFSDYDYRLFLDSDLP